MMYNDVKRSQEYWEQTTKDQRRKKNQGLIVAVLTLRMLLARRLLAEKLWHVLMFNEWQNHWKKSHRSWRASFRASSCSLGLGFASDMACRLHSIKCQRALGCTSQWSRTRTTSMQRSLCCCTLAMESHPIVDFS